MVPLTLFYIISKDFNFYALLLISVYLISFFLPMILHCPSIKVKDFIKGAVYSAYLSPTYIVIFPIYSICNLHDLSWGNRPQGNNAEFEEVQKAKDIMYRNFRSTTLLIWALTNWGIGNFLSYLAQKGSSDSYTVIQAFALFLSMVVGFKIIFSTLYSFKAYFYDRAKVHFYKVKKESSVFSEENMKKHQVDKAGFLEFHDVAPKHVEKRNVSKF